MVLDRFVRQAVLQFSRFVLLNVIRSNFSNRHLSEERDERTFECVRLDPLFGEPVVRHDVFFEPPPSERFECRILAYVSVQRLSPCQALSQNDFVRSCAGAGVLGGRPSVSDVIEAEVYAP
jgi:hypothetical protein